MLTAWVKPTTCLPPMISWMAALIILPSSEILLYSVSLAERTLLLSVISLSMMSSTWISAIQHATDNNKQDMAHKLPNLYVRFSFWSWCFIIVIATVTANRAIGRNVFRGRCLSSAYRLVQCVIIGGKTLKLLLKSFINEYRDSKEYLPVSEIRYPRKYVRRLHFNFI